MSKLENPIRWPSIHINKFVLTPWIIRVSSKQILFHPNQCYGRSDPVAIASGVECAGAPAMLAGLIARLPFFRQCADWVKPLPQMVLVLGQVCQQ